MKISAPAKINWALDILGKREDGYHYVDMVMQQVELFDYITVMESHEIKITCDNVQVPLDNKNLCYKAADLYFNEAKIKRGALINIEKNIPIEAGLAGGSSDGAAVLKALNEIYGALDEEKLSELAAKLGADVPFCLFGGTVRATNIGEVLTPINNAGVYNIVLIKPPFGANTKKVYSAYDDSTTKEIKTFTEGTVGALNKGDVFELAQKMGNALEPITFSLLPELTNIKAEVLRSGALNAIMSGSGPTIIGLYETEKDAETAQKMLKETFANYFIYKTKTL